MLPIKDRHTHLDASEVLEYRVGEPQQSWPWEVAYRPGWRSVRGAGPVMGFDSRPYWFRIALANQSGEEQLLMVDAGVPLLDKLDAFLIAKGRLMRVWKTGIQRGVGTKPYPSKVFTFPLSLQPGDEVQLYFRAEHQGFLTFPLSVTNLREHALKQSYDKLQMGVTGGVFILAGLYALLLYGFIRESRFLYYALFCFSLMASAWILKGYAGSYLLFPSWLSGTRSLLSCVGLLLLALVLSTLDMYRVWLTQRQRQLGHWVVGLILIGAVLPWLLDFKQGLFVLFGLYSLVTLLALLLVFFFIGRAGWLQRLYSNAALGFLASCLLLFANHLGWWQQGWITDYLISAFSALAAALLVFALAYRTYQEKRGRLRAKRQVSEGLKRYFELYHNANEGLFTSTLEGQLMAANPAFCRLFGYADFQIMASSAGRKTQSLYAQPNERDDLLAQLFSNSQQGVRKDVQMRRPDGTTFWARLSLRISHREGKNRPFLIEGILVDITEGKEYQARLEFLTTHDEVTGLHNRRYLMGLLEALFVRRAQDPGTDYLCFIDIDHFNLINEGGGHLAGDEFLKLLAQQLGQKMTSRFALTRLSGDEFAILLENTYVDEAIRFAEQCRKLIQEQRFIWDSKIYSVTASLGLVPIQPGCHDASALMALADAACSTAKRQGRNRLHVYSDLSPEMRQYQNEVAWVSRINQALAENRFVLARQLIIPAHGGGGGQKYEILLRLLGEQGELISPVTFLGAAERFGLMPAIDLWVLKNLMAWYQDHPDELAKLEQVSVNLSGESVGTPKMHRKLQQILEAARFPMNKLCFEITETQAIANIDATRAFITSFKALGCRFALDDFGSGFSSYGHLKDLPVDWLKIDGQFVEKMDQNPTDAAIVRSMAELARAVGVKTVAEYVANPAIEAQLTKMGVDYLQGYAIHRPTLLSDPLLLGLPGAIAVAK
ncbi:EAL domain-containing protein [Pseudaeromonas sp. ZJS20]|uniref:EAL domain-containing protein n=1 Tax=Pseudaeromonas aegiceratis TaxID=3153928 RepID=UPI00390CB1AE